MALCPNDADPQTSDALAKHRIVVGYRLFGVSGAIYESRQWNNPTRAGQAISRAAGSDLVADDAERIASTICSGLIGVALNSAPNGASASAMALAIAAGGATAPPSPTPLTPSGLSGEGECWWISAMSGTSQAVGTM